MKSSFRWPTRYAAALGAVGAGLLLRVGLTALVGEGLPTYITFYPAVMIAALLGGLGPGLLATAAAAVAADYWVIPPQGFGTERPVDAVGLALFFGMGVLMSWVAHLYRRTGAKVAAYEGELALRDSLRQSEERFRSLVEQASDGIFVSDAQGRYTEVNSAGCEMLGYSRDELLRLSIADVIAADEAPRIGPEAARFAGGKVVRSEWRFRRKDGSLFPGEVTGRQLADGRLQAILRDITERRQAQEALAVTARKFQSMFDTTSDGVWIHDLHGQILEVNDAYCSMSGYGRNELLHGPISRLEAKESPEEIAAHIEKLLHAGGHDRFESRHRRKDGSLYDVDVTALYLDIEGGRIAMFVRDITERKQAEEKLRQSAAELQSANASLLRSRHAALNLMDDAVRARLHAEQASAELRESQERLAAFAAATFEGIVLSEQGRIVDCNEQFAELFGCTASEMKGVQIHDLVAPEDRQRVLDNIQEGRESIIEHQMLRRDGSRITVETHGRPSQFSGRDLRHTAVRDVTERKRREEELQKLNRTLRAAQDSSRAMLRATSEPEYLDEVCRIVVEDCGHAMVWIGFAEPDEAKSVRPVAHAGFEAGYLETLNITSADTERGRGPTGTAIRTGKPCACKNMLTDPAFAPWREQAVKRGYASSLVLPLLTDGKAFGAVTFYSRQVDAFSEDEVQLLGQLADDLAHGITTLRLREAHERAEEQLRLLSTAVESAANGITISDRQGRLLWVNPAFTRLTGYSAAEAAGQNPRLLKSGRHPPEFYRHMWETILGGEPWHGELVNRRKDGSLYSEEMTITPVHAGGADITHFVAIKQDITLRKAAEDELEKRMDELVAVREELEDQNKALVASRQQIEFERARYHDLFNFAPDAYLVTDRRGVIREVNDAACALAGEGPGFLLKIPIANLFAPGTRREVLHWIRQFKQGQLEKLAPTEVAVQVPHRQAFPALVNVNSITDTPGAPSGLRWQLHDITHRKRAEIRADLLAETASQLLKTDSPQNVVESLCTKVLAFLDCQAFFNFLVDEASGRLHLNACAGVSKAAAGKIEWLDLGQAVCGCAARDACRVVAEDILHVPDPRTDLVKSCGIQAYACHPIMAQGRVLGTLSFGTRNRPRFTDDELALMQAVTDQVAMAMERQRAQVALQKLNEQLEERVAKRTAEVREKSRLLEALFQHSLDSLVFLDKDFNFLRVNQAYARACQRDAAEFPGHNHFEFYPHAENQAIFREVVRTRKPFQVAAKAFTFPDHPEWGVTYWDWSLVPVLDARGEVDFLVFSLRDVTKRARAEHALEAASRYARSLIEASLDPLLTISHEGKITDVNHATELVTGVAREVLISSDFSGYFTRPEEAKQGYQKVLAEGLVRDYPLTIRHASGRTTDVLYNASVYRNDTGQVLGVFAAARDITERKEAERRRDFTGQLLELFAQKTSANDYLNSVVAIIRRWSGCQALGIRILNERGEIPYESWAGFEPGFLELEDRLSLAQDQNQCLCIRAVTGSPLPGDRAILTPGGSFRCDDAIAFAAALPPEHRTQYRANCMKFGFASLAIIPVRYREQAIGMIHLADRRHGQFPPAAVEFIEAMTPLIGEALHRFQTEAELARHRDHLEVLVKQRTNELTIANARLELEIAQRRHAQASLEQTARELERSNRDLEQFAYVASHDLQEPLRAVGGFVKLLERRAADKLDARALEFITGAVDGAGRMERLITDLLAFSRVGTRGGAFAPADLEAALDDALRNLQASIKETDATVTRDPLPTVRVDATQLVQLFQNLVGNALKFHGERPPQIHIGARQEPGRWLFSVRDNGIGMEPQYFERIFQVFQRLHTRKRYPGTGIGLAICKRIVERHGGGIWVESQPGQGATFYFSIPETTGKTPPGG